MSEVYFEDELIKIEEDVETMDVSYDIRGEQLIETKTLKQSLSSKIYNYDDGISVYLKFESGGGFMNLMFAIYKANTEKQILSVPRHANIYLKRIDKRHFHILTIDDNNHEQNITLVTIKDDDDIMTIQFNFTQLVEYKLLDDEYVLINGYEDIGNGAYLYVMGVYNLAGKAIKVFVDKKVKSLGYGFFTQQLPNGRRRLLALYTQNQKPKTVGKLLLPEGFSKETTNMLEINKQIIKTKQQKEETESKLAKEDVISGDTVTNPAEEATLAESSENEVPDAPPQGEASEPAPADTQEDTTESSVPAEEQKSADATAPPDAEDKDSDKKEKKKKSKEKKVKKKSKEKVADATEAEQT